MLLEINNISKRFGGLIALSDINVTFQRGEIVGMIGSNGSGKTTFVNVCTGFLKPEQGSILLDGANITNSPPHERVCLGISRTFQATRLFRNLTVGQNISLANQSHYKRLNRKSALEGTEEILERIDLSNKTKELADSLTLFEQKKLEIGMRLISKPKLLMLDEPVGGLSPSEISEMLTLLRKLSEKVNLFIIEHTMKVIFTLAERVLVLNSGVLLANGTPSEISKNPAVIEAYLGSTTTS